MLAKEKRLVGMPGEGTIYANVRGLERIWHTGGQQTAFHSQSTRNGILNFEWRSNKRQDGKKRQKEESPWHATVKVLDLF